MPMRPQRMDRRLLNREIGHDVLSWFYVPSRGHQPIKTAGAPRQLTERPVFAGGSVPVGQPRPLHYFGRTHAATISVSNQQYNTHDRELKRHTRPAKSPGRVADRRPRRRRLKYTYLCDWLTGRSSLALMDVDRLNPVRRFRWRALRAGAMHRDSHNGALWNAQASVSQRPALRSRVSTSPSWSFWPDKSPCSCGELPCSCKIIPCFVEQGICIWGPVMAPRLESLAHKEPWFLRNSLFISLLAGNSESGDRFAMDCVRHHVVWFSASLRLDQFVRGRLCRCVGLFGSLAGA